MRHDQTTARTHPAGARRLPTQRVGSSPPVELGTTPPTNTDASHCRAKGPGFRNAARAYRVTKELGERSLSQVKGPMECDFSPRGGGNHPLSGHPPRPHHQPVVIAGGATVVARAGDESDLIASALSQNRLHRDGGECVVGGLCDLVSQLLLVCADHLDGVARGQLRQPPEDGRPDAREILVTGEDGVAARARPPRPRRQRPFSRPGCSSLAWA